jgi:glyoxylase-like metal-dependent hydrolase (beta-lactamase superfamily II)/rhodanese-related sulfurtransferase
MAVTDSHDRDARSEDPSSPTRHDRCWIVVMPLPDRVLFRQLFDLGSSTYTYLVADETTREALLVDPVFEQFTRDRALIRELGLTLRYTLETHVHADHVTAAWRFRDALGSRIVLSKQSGADGADLYTGEGDTVTVGVLTLAARATPGHTNGCTTWVTADQSAAFTGDALLIRGAGRTDFQQGDPRALYRSIRTRIFTLPNACLLYPAHDYEGRTVTTVGEEKQWNARVGGAASEDDFVGYMTNLGLPHPKQIDIAVPANLRCGRPEPEALTDAPAWSPVIRTFGGVPEIEPTWVAEHGTAVTLLDVRETVELTGELGRIPDSLHIPLGELRARLADVPRDRPIVAVCRSGRRSAQASVILENAGVHDVASLAGGMIRWRALRL